MSDELFYLLAGAFIGSLIGIFFKFIYDSITYRIKVGKIKDSITDELEDLVFRLKLIFSSYELALKNYAKSNFYSEVQVPLANPIFKKYYPEVSLEFRASQRRSLTLINSYIDNVNSGIENIRDQNHNTIKNFNDENFRIWGEMIKAEYNNTALAYWHIEYHLKNKEFPFLDLGNSKEHEEYVQYQKSIDKSIEDIINIPEK